MEGSQTQPQASRELSGPARSPARHPVADRDREPPDPVEISTDDATAPEAAEPRHHKVRDTFWSFARALLRRHTYDARRNPYLRFGFLWGLPVPFFAIALDLRLYPGTSTALELVLRNPYHWFFVAHPLLFALWFGAFGTMRRDLETRNERLLEKLGRLATTDSLTGLYNRRFALEALRQGLLRAARTGEELAVVIFDLDGFKAVNEDRGHLAGDALLREVAAELRRTLRKSDVLGRYGGDEFLLVLHGDADRAEDVIDRAQRAVRRRTGMEVSAGVAHGPGDAHEPGALVGIADLRLRASKSMRYPVGHAAKRRSGPDAAGAPLRAIRDRPCGTRAGRTPGPACHAPDPRR